ncbi:MAG: hypothetical protein IPK13_08820 [Deltaproteobacteria bacterium]|nr:hypothetical protein [Deltaproteobacteria bacterium]
MIRSVGPQPSRDSRGGRRSPGRLRRWALLVAFASGCAPLPSGDGRLVGSSAKEDDSVVNQYAMCELPWNRSQVDEGTVVDAYSEKNLPAGDTCERVHAKLSCRSGTLWLVNPSLERSETDFRHGTCTVASNTPTPAPAPAPSTPDPTTPDPTTPDPTTPDPTTPEAPPPILTCATPSGATLQPGDSIQLFSTTRVSFGQTCAAYAQVRTCLSDGTLSGDSAYGQSSCVADQASSCNLPWGGVLAHGGSVTAYLTQSAPPGASCAQETRVCSNGQLTGSYSNPRCVGAEYVGLYDYGTLLGTSLHSGAWAFGFSADFTNGQNRPHFQRIFNFQNLTSQGCFLFFSGNVNIIEATHGNPDLKERIPSLGSTQGLYIPPGFGNGAQVNFRIYPMANVQYSSEFVLSCRDMSGVPHNIPIHVDITN